MSIKISKKIFEFLLIIFLALIFWLLQKEYFTKNQPGLSLISDSVMYLVQARAYIDGAGESGTGLLAVNMKGYSIVIAIIKKLFFFDKDWTYYSTVAQNINIISSFIPFLVVYITCRFYKRPLTESILCAFVALSFPRVWYYNQYAMTEAFTATVILLLIAGLLYLYKEEKISIIVATIIAISYFFGFTSKTVSQYVVIALCTISLFHFKEKIKKYFILAIMITCFLAKYILNLDAYAYSGFLEATVTNIFDFNIKYYLIVVVSFFITVSWSSQYIIPLISQIPLKNFFKRIEIHYLACVFILPLLITSLFSGTINTLGQYRGFMLFEPAMYYLSLIIYFSNESYRSNNINKYRIFFLIILAVIAPVLLVINKYYLNLAFHTWDSMHMPIFSYISNEIVISRKTWIYIYIFCIVYILSLFQKNIKIISILILFMSLLNIVVAIKSDYISERGRINFASTENMHYEYSKELYDNWPNKNIVLGRIGGDSWTVMGYPYVMRFWGKWSDQDYLVKNNYYENSLILSKNMIANLKLIDENSFNRKYYLYDDENINNLINIDFRNAEEYYGNLVFNMQTSHEINKAFNFGYKSLMVPVFLPKDAYLIVKFLGTNSVLSSNNCTVSDNLGNLKKFIDPVRADKFQYNFILEQKNEKPSINVLRIGCNLNSHELAKIRLEIETVGR
jgi:hypothetical protein